jgi:hypothetical protein
MMLRQLQDVHGAEERNPFPQAVRHRIGMMMMMKLTTWRSRRSYHQPACKLAAPALMPKGPVSEASCAVGAPGVVLQSKERFTVTRGKVDAKELPKGPNGRACCRVCQVGEFRGNETARFAGRSCSHKGHTVSPCAVIIKSEGRPIGRGDLPPAGAMALGPSLGRGVSPMVRPTPHRRPCACGDCRRRCRRGGRPSAPTAACTSTACARPPPTCASASWWVHGALMGRWRPEFEGR